MSIAQAKLYDLFQFLWSLSALRIVNYFQITISYYISKALKKPMMWGMPVTMSIEPTTSCNLRCPECISGLRAFTRPTGMLQPEVFDSFLQQMSPRAYYLNFYFQGEPYLNPDFLSMVKKANRKKLYTSTSTNAHYLDPESAKRTVESGLSRLILSIDGTTQETYQQYRIGGNLDKVIEGARNIVAARTQAKSRTPYLIFQFLVVKPNEHQVEDVLRLAQELDVDEVKFKTAQVYDYENGNPLIPEQEKYSRYKKGRDGKFRMKFTMQNECWRMWQGAVVTWDGKMVPCCFDKDAQYSMGDLTKHTLSDVWQGEAYRNFRKHIFIAREEIDICTNCTEGAKVWA